MEFGGSAVAVLVIIFVSTLVRAVFGFGHALVAMPLLAMTMIGMRTAAPLVALIAGLQALLIIAKNWRDIDLKCTWRLLVATLPGVPLGILLIKGPYENAAKIILALIITGFSAYSLLKPRLMMLKSEWTAYPFGFIAGILGGAFNSNGPPIVIYGTLRRWPTDCFRATLQGYFFPASIVTISGHALGGLVTQTVGWYFLLSLPVLALSTWAGHRLSRLIPQGRFVKYVHILLILVGTLLFVQTVAS